MLTLAIALALHALAAVFWVGGMLFVLFFVRPVAGRVLEAPQRLALFRGVLGRFFPVVWLAIAVLLASGYYMVLGPYGGFAQAGAHIHTMHALALLMAVVFAHVFFAPWKRFRRALDRGEQEAAAAELGRIRALVLVNLGLGVVVVLVATGGRYWY